MNEIHARVRHQWAGLLALFLILAGGGAYAAIDPIGSDGDIDACYEKRSGDLDLHKGKKCGKGERKLAWGEVGPQGPAGPAGRSALEGLRSGETVRGVVGGQENAAAGSTEYFVLETLTIPAPEPLTDDKVVVQGPYDDSEGVCQGDFANPTAPAGRVCIYGSTASVGTNTEEEEGTSAAFNQGSPYGFGLRFYSEAAGEASVFASWAYTAP